jgi:hypothetical protein
MRAEDPQTAASECGTSLRMRGIYAKTSHDPQTSSAAPHAPNKKPTTPPKPHLPPTKPATVIAVEGRFAGGSPPTGDERGRNGQSEHWQPHLSRTVS